MRGEDGGGELKRSPPLGSPPHARGRLKIVAQAMKTVRITPACAGKTEMIARAFGWRGDHPRMRGEDWTATPNRQKRTPDHPRMRGEDFECKTLDDVLKGSPPHARGRHSLP